ncbi:unnamed protein product [Meganyctiphanes norvegica]|uniref:Protein quiver n=1 Tax=Meganyctiphanes norvegica TaxID=48144 RepID=A0AAV2Q2I7_MEGNR
MYIVYSCSSTVNLLKVVGPHQLTCKHIPLKIIRSVMAKATGIITLSIVICTAGAALKCYVCDPYDPRCTDPVGHNDLISEESNLHYTYKTCNKLLIETDYETTVDRLGNIADLGSGCLTWTDGVTDPSENQKGNIRRITSCNCQEDLCNGAPTVNVGIMTLIAAFFLYLHHLLH